MVLALFAFAINPSSGLLIFCTLCAVSVVLAKPSQRLAVTLSVNELLMDVLDAFKTEIPFMLNAFSTDFSSKTAVKGDKITAHIATLPAVQAYDPTTGFANNAAAADSLLTDVPVTLSSFNIVNVKVTWLTQLASKVPLYKEAIRSYGYVMAKKVLDDILATVTAANFSHSEVTADQNVVLEAMELYRSDLNAQKATSKNRFGLVSTAFAQNLQNDDRVKSSLFYGMLNDTEGYRTFKNLAGFQNVWEYPDFPTNNQNLSAFFGDKRSVVIANRRIDFSNAAAELGVTQIMNFYPISDPETGLEMTGVAYQQPGTGDVYVAAGVLYGIGSGDQGGAADSITGKAGLRVTRA